MQSPDPRAEEASNERPTDPATAVPPELDSPRAKLVYLYLQTAERADAEQLTRDLGLKQLSLYPILETLAARGHVQRQGSTFVAR